METGVVDSVVNGDTTVSYEISENYSLQNEDLSGNPALSIQNGLISIFIKLTGQILHCIRIKSVLY